MRARERKAVLWIVQGAMLIAVGRPARAPVIAGVERLEKVAEVRVLGAAEMMVVAR